MLITKKIEIVDQYYDYAVKNQDPVTMLFSGDELEKNSAARDQILKHLAVMTLQGKKVKISKDKVVLG